MEKLSSSLQFDECIQENPLLLVYFSGENCNVCTSLKPKVEALVHEKFQQIKLIEVPTGEAPELSARFRVFTVPVVLFFVEGREYLREARLISIPDLAGKLDKLIGLYEQ
jgi:thiol-disulfide isomerase/thioredoxin